MKFLEINSKPREVAGTYAMSLAPTASDHTILAIKFWYVLE